MKQYKSLGSTMETRNHSKNGASPKSLMSRGKNINLDFFMKRYALLVFLSVFTLSINGQSDRRKALLNDFLYGRDVSYLVHLAHPTCDDNGISVTYISDESEYADGERVGLFYGLYGGWFSDFKCQYCLVIDANGVFKNFYSAKCGGGVDCFSTSVDNKIEEFFRIKEIPLYINERSINAMKIFEKRKGKAYFQCDNREKICCALFILWYVKGYYRQY